MIGAGLGALAGGVIYGLTSAASGRTFSWVDLGTSVAVGAAGGALIGTGVGATAGVAALASIGAGTGVIGSQVGYSAIAGKDFDSRKLVATSAVGGVTGAVTGVLGAPASINPISSPAAAFGARMLVNGVSGMADYSLSGYIDGVAPSAEGLRYSAGLGLATGLVGEALPGYRSQTLEQYGPQVFQRSIVKGEDEFNQTLRLFVTKELSWQAGDDALRGASVSYLNNVLQNRMISK